MLSLEQSIRVIGLLGFEGFDLVLLGNGSYLKPEAIVHIGDWGAGVRRLLDAEGLEAADVFCVPWTDFTTMAPNHPDATERDRVASSSGGCSNSRRRSGHPG